MLGLTDALWSRWTQAQWEAVAGRLESKGIQEIARDSGIRFQNVSKRLIAASWNEVHQAMNWLELAEAAAVPEKSAVQPIRHDSPSRG